MATLRSGGNSITTGGASGLTPNDIISGSPFIIVDTSTPGVVAIEASYQFNVGVNLVGGVVTVDLVPPGFLGGYMAIPSYLDPIDINAGILSIEYVSPTQFKVHSNNPLDGNLVQVLMIPQ